MCWCVAGISRSEWGLRGMLTSSLRRARNSPQHTRDLRGENSQSIVIHLSAIGTFYDNLRADRADRGCAMAPPERCGQTVEDSDRRNHCHDGGSISAVGNTDHNDARRTIRDLENHATRRWESDTRWECLYFMPVYILCLHVTGNVVSVFSLE